MLNFSNATSMCACLLSSEIVRSIRRNFHPSSCQWLASHYETLQVKQDCTNKEIREAFIKLSKEFHPDKNQNDPNNHTRFVKVNDAYSILSKPNKRLDYDLSLVPTRPVADGRANSTQRGGSGPFRDDTFWEQRDKRHDRAYASRPYYGIAGLRKLPNSWVVAFCVFFTMLGVGLQLLAISKSMAFQRDQLDETSIRNSLLHSYVREQAQSNGNEMQLELVRKRLLDPKVKT